MTNHLKHTWTWALIQHFGSLSILVSPYGIWGHFENLSAVSGDKGSRRLLSRTSSLSVSVPHMASHSSTSVFSFCKQKAEIWVNSSITDPTSGADLGWLMRLLQEGGGNSAKGWNSTSADHRIQPLICTTCLACRTSGRKFQPHMNPSLALLNQTLTWLWPPISFGGPDT